MKNLIINADDFGISSEANQAIKELFLSKALSSATIMVNMERSSDEAMQIALDNKIPVGLHFNLTLNNEYYPNRKSFERAYSLGRMTKRYIIEELQKQYYTLLSKGITPTHIDSHQHIHNIPGIFKIVAKFAKEKGIPVRIPEEWPIFNKYDKPALKDLMKDLKQLIRKDIALLFSKINKLQAKMIGVKTNKQLVSIFALWPRPKMINEKHLELVLKKCQNGTEYMCHPITKNNHKRLTSIADYSAAEYLLMTKKGFLDIIRQRKIKLINFGEM
jgi:predicted glycoside hydrolase/deacetylase ChbG (UPF0249 family)